MEPHVTVVISTYNGADRINIPMEALLAQRVPRGMFEIIVVDNASTDGTAGVVRHSMQLLLQKGIQCRVVREERQGATFARIRGAQEARAEIVCFLDDDMVPEPNYIAELITGFSAPDIGLLISTIYPVYETQPSSSISRREHLHGINRKLGDAVIDWGAAATIAPTNGGGMSVRRSAFLAAIPWQKPDALLADRVGDSLAGCGDIEFGYLIGKAGYRRVYWPRLRAGHVIPEKRLESAYIWRLIIGAVRSELTLRARCEGKLYTSRTRVRAFVSLLIAGLAFPVLLFRKDGLREVLFVLASRWAALLGPFTVSRSASVSNAHRP